MSFFDRFKKKEEEEPVRKSTGTSNTTLEQLGLMDQLNREVIVICDREKNDSIVNKDGEVEVWVRPDIIEETYENPRVAVIKLLKAIDYVIQHPISGLRICGLVPFPLYITHEDLQPIKDEIDSICIMTAYLEKKISVGEFWERMKDKKVYYIGHMPTHNDKDIEVITLKHNSNEYDMIPAYLIRQHAERSKFLNGHPINETTVGQLAFFWHKVHGLILEPEEKSWVLFSPEELATGVEKN